VHVSHGLSQRRPPGLAGEVQGQVTGQLPLAAADAHGGKARRFPQPYTQRAADQAMTDDQGHGSIPPRCVAHVLPPIAVAVHVRVLANEAVVCRRGGVPDSCAPEPPGPHTNYDRGRTIWTPVLTIITIVLKTSREAYKNDQSCRSERS